MSKKVSPSKKVVPVECGDCNRQYTLLAENKKRSIEIHGYVKCRSCAKLTWTPITVAIEALKYKTRGELQANSQSAYKYARRINIIDSVCSHMKKVKGAPFKEFRGVSGLYELLYKGNIVYIGKSDYDVSRRLYAHTTNEDKVFDTVVVYEIENTADLHIAELYLINKLKPKYNKADVSPMIVTLRIPNIDDIILKSTTIIIKGDK